MTLLPPHSETEDLLRIEFDHSVSSTMFTGFVTLGDFARMQGRLVRDSHGDPVAVVITLGQHDDEAARRHDNRVADHHAVCGS